MSEIMRRREALRIFAGLPLVACSKAEPATTARMPVIFAAHGAPMILEEASWMSELASWSKAMPRPRAILVVSAHWVDAPLAFGATRPVPLEYDFSGFPQRFYETTYSAPGAPDLAERVAALAARPTKRTERGLDHGAYVPLVAMYPAADVPVLQLSLPALDPSVLLDVGKKLAPLRDEGVLVFGSGFLTHNMRYGLEGGTPQWAAEFDLWAEDAIVRFDLDALADFRAKAPAAKLALPTWEHYAPLLVAAGAAARAPSKITFPIRGFWHESAFTRRSVQFG